MFKTLREPKWFFFGASIFLVSVPVFFQAPLVRSLPNLSLVMTTFLFALSISLRSEVKARRLGELLDGFAWTWLAGSIYWGWFRTEPFLHLPMEAIGLPIALFSILNQRNKIGSWFYLGSLFGTCMTDLYFYLVNLIPQWRQLMKVDLSLAPAIFQDAISKIETPWGSGCAVVIIAVLIGVGLYSLSRPQLHWRVFSGAVFSTVLVDGLFWVAATSA